MHVPIRFACHSRMVYRLRRLPLTYVRYICFRIAHHQDTSKNVRDEHDFRPSQTSNDVVVLLVIVRCTGLETIRTPFVNNYFLIRNKRFGHLTHQRLWWFGCLQYHHIRLRVRVQRFVAYRNILKTQKRRLHNRQGRGSVRVGPLLGVATTVRCTQHDIFFFLTRALSDIRNSHFPRRSSDAQVV